MQHDYLIALDERGKSFHFRKAGFVYTEPC